MFMVLPFKKDVLNARVVKERIDIHAMNSNVIQA